jgi:hypothetical protein
MRRHCRDRRAIARTGPDAAIAEGVARQIVRSDAAGKTAAVKAFAHAGLQRGPRSEPAAGALIRADLARSPANLLADLEQNPTRLHRLGCSRFLFYRVFRASR